jgi:predicted amidohydrolase
VPEVDGEVFYNTVGVVGPEGFVTRYRKRALYYIDEAYATPGEAAGVLETPFGAFGLMICMDGTYDGGYYDEYRDLRVDAIILSMDWDQDPLGAGAAASWFVERAENNDVEIYAADVSPWDGTGKYVPGEAARERNGLPDPAIGVDGISYHRLGY